MHTSNAEGFPPPKKKRKGKGKGEKGTPFNTYAWHATGGFGNHFPITQLSQKHLRRCPIDAGAPRLTLGRV